MVKQAQNAEAIEAEIMAALDEGEALTAEELMELCPGASGPDALQLVLMRLRLERKLCRKGGRGKTRYCRPTKLAEEAPASKPAVAPVPQKLRQPLHEEIRQMLHERALSVQQMAATSKITRHEGRIGMACRELRDAGEIVWRPSGYYELRP